MVHAVLTDRLSTLGKVRKAGLKVCCGGIVGMNETRKERSNELIASLANLDPQPESSADPNQPGKVEGTPFEADAEKLDWTELARTIARCRVLPYQKVMFVFLQLSIPW